MFCMVQAMGGHCLRMLLTYLPVSLYRAEHCNGLCGCVYFVVHSAGNSMCILPNIVNVFVCAICLIGL